MVSIFFIDISIKSTGHCVCLVFVVLWHKFDTYWNYMQTHTTDTRKPAFRWLGVRGKVKNEPTVLTESRKRAFGTDVTNVSYKKTKAESSAYQGLNHCLNMQKLVQCENSSQEDSQNSQDQECERTSKSYQFGPFAPVTVAKVGVSDNNNTKRTHDWESLSSTFRPQYHNQGKSP